MNKRKLMVGLISAVLLILSTAMVVGAEEQTSTVTLINKASETAVSLEGKTYQYYKIFDVVVSGEDVLHTVDSDFTNYFTGTLTDGNGADFIFLSSTDSNYSANVAEYIDTFRTSGNMTTLVTNLRNYVNTSNIWNAGADYTSTGMIATTTGDGDIIERVSTEVAYGYYLILDSANYVGNTNDIVAPGMLVDVTEESLIVYTKASTPVLDKYIWHDDEDSTDEGSTTTGEWDVVGDHQTGQTIYYKVSSTVPTDYTGYDDYTYVITTQKAQGVTYNHDVKVYAYDTTSSSTMSFNEETLLFDGTYIGNESKFTKNADGYMEYTEGYFTIEYAIDDTGDVLVNDFILTVDVIGLRASPEYLDNNSIYLSYSGVAKEGLGTTEESEIDATTLTYSNNPYDSDSTGTYDEVVYHHVFDITVFKTANDTVTPLAGATFALYRTDNGVVTQIYLEKDDEQTINGITIYHTTTDVGASDTEGIIVTDEGGKFLIYGLNDAVDYSITELDAPDGYNKAAPVEFRITATYDQTGEVLQTISTENSAITSADADSLTTTIVNSSKTLLPSTGGAGSAIFMIVGALLMLGALAVLMVMKRKERK